VQQAGGTVQDVNNVVRIKVLAEWQAGDILKAMDKAKGGQPYQDRPSTACTVQVVDGTRPLTHVEMGLGATKQQADQVASRVQLVRDSLTRPPTSTR
jgi:hypothetical protein